MLRGNGRCTPGTWRHIHPFPSHHPFFHCGPITVAVQGQAQGIAIFSHFPVSARLRSYKRDPATADSELCLETSSACRGVVEVDGRVICLDIRRYFQLDQPLNVLAPII